MRFKEAVRIENEIKKIKGVPIAGYDEEKRTAYLEYPDGGENMQQSQNEKLPEIIVFAVPNESGKSTITKMAKVIEPYINADDIKKTNYCSDLEAAQMAERMRECAVSHKKSFTFETVMSTERNLNLLKKAKEQGYFIRCIYVLTADVNINIFRVESREAVGDMECRKIKYGYGIRRL